MRPMPGMPGMFIAPGAPRARISGAPPRLRRETGWDRRALFFSVRRGQCFFRGIDEIRLSSSPQNDSARGHDDARTATRGEARRRGGAAEVPAAAVGEQPIRRAVREVPRGRGRIKIHDDSSRIPRRRRRRRRRGVGRGVEAPARGVRLATPRTPPQRRRSRPRRDAARVERRRAVHARRVQGCLGDARGATTHRRGSRRGVQTRRARRERPRPARSLRPRARPRRRARHGERRDPRRPVRGRARVHVPGEDSVPAKPRRRVSAERLALARGRDDRNAPRRPRRPTLELDFAHGFPGRDNLANTLHVSKHGDAVYYLASMGVVYDAKKHTAAGFSAGTTTTFGASPRTRTGSRSRPGRTARSRARACGPRGTSATPRCVEVGGVVDPIGVLAVDGRARVFPGGRSVDHRRERR